MLLPGRCQHLCLTQQVLLQVFGRVLGSLPTLWLSYPPHRTHAGTIERQNKKDDQHH